MNLKHITCFLVLLSFLSSCKEEPLLKPLEVPMEIKSGDFFSQPDKYTNDNNSYESHSGIIIVPENRDKPNSR